MSFKDGGGKTGGGHISSLPPGKIGLSPNLIYTYITGSFLCVESHLFDFLCGCSRAINFAVQLFFKLIGRKLGT